MNNAMSILFNALVDSFRPKMLMLTLVSVAIASVFWLVVIWLSIDPLVNAAMWALSFVGLDFSVEALATDAAFLGWLKFILVPLAVFGLLWPIVATSAVLLAGLYVTPPVVNYLTDKEFQGIAKKGDSGTVMSLWVTLKAVVVFLIAWIVTLPLWLIPGMAFVLPVLLTAYLLMAVMRFDSLAGHATKLEIKEIKKRDSTSAWLIGLVCAFLSFIPPILLIMPVMSALAFTRHYMGALVKVREDKVIEMPMIETN
ncbi:EI24 domain-containing protein [Limnobacter parvus]|uniref:EI24 domain-containing protein n=1 Tax=Limnobacter parvus TaxID=2939690 RepID=A0ABT1XIF8_9BURK|nr:EI24 domain-containing protein [Limnobacter parvus]MCR2747045.1 EI24 domain-containing protein [Limnobacter parvus]